MEDKSDAPCDGTLGSLRFRPQLPEDEEFLWQV